MKNQVKLGDLAIFTDCDRPYTRLLALVVKIDGSVIVGQYISSDGLSMDGPSVAFSSVTPAWKFGVHLFIKGRCLGSEVVARSSAEYEDGKPRTWNGRGEDLTPIKRGLMGRVRKAVELNNRNAEAA